MIWDHVHTERQMRATTGLSSTEFKNLLPRFKRAYADRYQLTLSNREAQQTYHSVLDTRDKLLFFVLFQLKNALTFDVLGCSFGMGGTCAKKNFESGLAVLKLALHASKLMPVQEFKDDQELAEFLYNNKELWVDATEIPIQRPDNEQVQKEMYSGKKKRHGLKSMIITNCCKTILFLSKVVRGSVHDYTLFKQIFCEKSGCLRDNIVFTDLGYLGIVKDFKPEYVVMPVKRSKNDTNADHVALKRAFNKLVSQMRIGVEHAIGGMKKFRMASQTIRSKSCKTVDDVLGVCAGLWNFSLLSFDPE